MKYLDILWFLIVVAFLIPGDEATRLRNSGELILKHEMDSSMGLSVGVPGFLTSLMNFISRTFWRIFGSNNGGSSSGSLIPDSVNPAQFDTNELNPAQYMNEISNLEETFEENSDVMKSRAESFVQDQISLDEGQTVDQIAEQVVEYTENLFSNSLKILRSDSLEELRANFGSFLSESYESAAESADGVNPMETKLNPDQLESMIGSDGMADLNALQQMFNTIETTLVQAEQDGLVDEVEEMFQWQNLFEGFGKMGTEGEDEDSLMVGLGDAMGVVQEDNIDGGVDGGAKVTGILDNSFFDDMADNSVADGAELIGLV